MPAGQGVTGPASGGAATAAASFPASPASASSRPLAGPASASSPFGAPRTTRPSAAAASARVTSPRLLARPILSGPREDAVVPEQHLDRARPSVERIVVRAGHVLEVVRDAGGAPGGRQALDRLLEVVLLAREEAKR